MHLAVPADHKEKMKENRKIDNTWILLESWKKLLNMKVMMILTVVGALGTVPNELTKKLEELHYKWKNRDHSNHSSVKIG